MYPTGAGFIRHTRNLCWGSTTSPPVGQHINCEQVRLFTTTSFIYDVDVQEMLNGWKHGCRIKGVMDNDTTHFYSLLSQSAIHLCRVETRFFFIYIS